MTKSFISALVGIALDRGEIKSIDDQMVTYLSGYPEFGEQTLRYVLTHTTGLEWTEEGGEKAGPGRAGDGPCDKG